MFSQRAVAQSLRTVAPRTAIAPRVAVRGYAEAAAANTRPPVQLFGLDGTYASALVGQSTFNQAFVAGNMSRAGARDGIDSAAAQLRPITRLR